MVSEVREVAELFRGPMAVRNTAMFLLGCNTGFRVSEILALTIGDVLEENGSIKTHLTVSKRHMKGKKESRTVILNECGRRCLVPWLQELKKREVIHQDDPLFISIRGNVPIGRIQVWKVLTKAFRACGLTGKMGTHAMRKTFANNVYKHLLVRVAAGEAIDAFRTTSKALGHADIKSTDQYLSFLTEDVDTTIKAVGVL
jgi:integrase